MNSLYAIFFAALLAIALTIANIFLKLAASAGQQTVYELYTNNIGKISIALFFYFGVFLVYPLLLKYFPLNVIFPVYTGLTILFVTFAGAFLFQEKFALHQFVGIALLIIGIVLISWTSKNA
jgi:small multidrug resistance pump